MMLLDVLKGVKPRRRVRFGSIAAGATLLATLGAALPVITPTKQETQSALVEMLASGKRSKEIRPIVESSDAYLAFAKEIARVAVGNPEVIKLSTSDKKNLVLNGGKVGRTSLTVWFEGGANEQFMISVVRDLSVLEAALRSVHPNIHVEIAPDRDAVVLSGNVPDSSYSARAEAAALQYVAAGSTRGKTEQSELKNTGQVINLIHAETAPTNLERRLETEITRQGGKNVHVTRVITGAMPNDDEDVFVVEGDVAAQRALDNIRDLLNAMVPDEGDRDEQKDNPRVVNRMTTSTGALELEQVIEKAIREEVGCPNVHVSRVNEAQFRGEADILVLKGSVPSQTKLTQALALASRLFLQQQLIKNKLEGQFEDVTETFAGGNTRNTRRPLQLKSAQDDIKVAGDESGALRNSGNALGSNRSGRAIGRLRSATGGTAGGSGSSFGDLLGNQVDSNIARATALELAEGRILSFLTVDDLPQVRVDIRIVEINRRALLNWDSQQSATVSDFTRQSQIPHEFVDPDGDGTFVPVLGPPTGNVDVEDTLAFLTGGLSNALHISGDHVDINSFFRLLETEGIARTLSNPSLTVLSGELASFGVGGSIPISSTTLSGSGLATTETEFIDFGINLAVRPLVGEDGFITLDVVPEVSNPDAILTAAIRAASGTNPATTAFSSRVLRTSSRLRDGQALLIGGLTEHNRTDDSSQAPWLHKIPIVGWLFKDFSYADSDHELVIVVNPVIVRDVPDEASLWAFPGGAELMHCEAKAESSDEKAEK